MIERFRELVLLLPCYPRIVMRAGRGSAPRFQMKQVVWSMGLSEVLAKKQPGRWTRRKSGRASEFWPFAYQKTEALQRWGRYV